METGGLLAQHHCCGAWNQQDMITKINTVENEGDGRCHSKRKTTWKNGCTAEKFMPPKAVTMLIFQKWKKRFHYVAIECFSLTWPASMQIYWKNRKCLHKKIVQLPEDWFGTPTWPPFHCFGTPIWPPWRHVKNTLYYRVGRMMLKGEKEGNGL